MDFNIFERKKSRVLYLAKYYDSGERGWLFRKTLKIKAWMKNTRKGGRKK